MTNTVKRNAIACTRVFNLHDSAVKGKGRGEAIAAAENSDVIMNLCRSFERDRFNLEFANAVRDGCNVVTMLLPLTHENDTLRYLVDMVNTLKVPYTVSKEKADKTDNTPALLKGKDVLVMRLALSDAALSALFGGKDKAYFSDKEGLYFVSKSGIPYQRIIAPKGEVA